MKVIYEKSEGMKVPIKMWGDVEDSAIEQMKNVSRLPFIHKWLSIMPDGHKGYGCPIGAVIPCKGYILPYCIGMDISCGLSAIKLEGMKASDHSNEEIKSWFDDGFYPRIPSVNPSHEQGSDNIFDRSEAKSLCTDIVSSVTHEDYFGHGDRNLIDIIYHQVGTIGPNSNHFFELQKDQEDNLWLMTHSGSRKFGAMIGDYYFKKALEMCEKYHSPLPEKYLAYFPVDSDLGQEYIHHMNLASDYAYMNRREMISQALDCLGMNHIKDSMLNIHHNYAAIENHFGKNVWVHRKGATSARNGQIGIIPGSMCTKSYIVRGKGDKDSFMSCSHGSGRNFGRKESIRRIDSGLDAPVEEQLGDVMLFGSDDVRDEVGSSYKDITNVMKYQKHLVDIVHELTPIAVLKG